MTHDLTTGVYPAMTTPFLEDGSIDHDRLAANATRLEAAGVDGVVPVGSTGESATLTHQEHVDVVETVVEAVDVPVIAGAGSNATHEALVLSRGAEEAGADGLLLISPYYNKPEPAGMEAHYRAIADEVDLPQIIYNVPSRTGRNIAVETAVNLASHENIVGYKAASGDLGRVSEVARRTATEEFSVLSGDDGLTLPIISVGGTGVISVAANVEPERTVELVHSALEGDYEQAREVHRELAPLVEALFAETNPIPVKAAMEIRGHGTGRLRSPLSTISPENRRELEAVLADLAEGAE
ncbi:4-hydroxy-tetrahydrodipicolinate synthase [Halodesulfurarchaeum sp. HSR-GB]|uniref:4-hydroxy-tetrahydrodipicolinate synthase n=1 Tax=Halodesulfurarchaeum sp. HSR-GB TaxID=3074077 RepID=UPI002860C800|nr:4-hydroxy-tetrahydrodipicolinate synthase [Halodesulfurarchaeum sp. HSR-GB]MDR5656898.1 4-hydroxy-tetrahydrodipicolinate synthase [Halodesulfurarchaeum sp. HSR-GB]